MEEKKIIIIKNKNPQIDNESNLHSDEVTNLNNFFLSTDDKSIEKAIKIKLNSYIQQDVKKDRYDENNIVSFDYVVEKLVESKLKCYYCKCNVFINYTEIRQNNQWTLDRLNNNFGHNVNNVIISCLDCNIKRRRIRNDKFLFTKQLKIKKI